MTKGTIVRLLAGAALGGILFVSSAAVAGEGRGKKTPEERIAMVEKGVREKLAPKLGVDERTTERLVEIAKAEATKRMAAHEAVRKERQALRALIERKAGDKELDAQLRKLEDAEAAMPRPNAVLAETRRILTSEQQAKLALILPKIGQGHRGGGHHGRFGKGQPPAAQPTK